MGKLTERLVLARSRASDLENVRKLNCWASELTDISIIRKMPNVQIVSLSVNQLAALDDFTESMNLEELYIRKNEISDLAEIWHLRKLPRLRVLWLADNPCATTDSYRMTVLKTLPNLQRLDNVPVTEEEVNEAIVQGVDLEPLVSKSIKLQTTDADSSIKLKEGKEMANKEEEKEKVLELEDGYVERKSEPEKDPSSSEPEPEQNCSNSPSPVTVETDGHKLDPVVDTEKIQDEINESIVKESTSYSVDEKEMSTPNLAKVSMTDDDDDDEDNEEKAETSEIESKKSSDEHSLEEGEVILENPYKETNEIRRNFDMKPVPENKIMQPVHSRPSHSTKLRNSNILQAVLSLLKELDDDSLEIVSEAIRDKLESS